MHLISLHKVGPLKARGNLVLYLLQRPTPVTVRTKAQPCGRLIAGIKVSNPAEGFRVRLLSWLCFVQVAASATS